ncbi:MAG: P63C domain-containing protein [Phycisphaerales bacterium]|nr:MAG: P63C domain-containing protein [Phycisphaerales bacterium]
MRKKKRGLIQEQASKGGKARAKALSPDGRREIARQAVIARWSGKFPQATHTGELVVAGRAISCAVLETGKRLLTQESFLTAVGRAGKAKAGKGSLKLVDGLPPFLAAENLKPFISEDLRESTTPVVFRAPKGQRAFGYDAMLLPKVCEVYLMARDQDRLLASQKHIAHACDLLMRGLAHVGIIALVDEATGYQEERAKAELQKILEAYISDELLPWTKRFPDDFFRQIYRLQGWAYKPGTAKRTPYIGKLINKYVYEKLPEGVLPALRSRNPVTGKGWRTHKHHQFLTVDTGNKHLDRQITAVLTIMRVSEDKDQFEELFEKAFPVPFQQMRLPLVVEVEASS